MDAPHPAAPDPDPNPPVEGPRRLGPYRLGERIGRGGQGVVYVADDERLGRRVAVKVLHGLEAATGEELQRFAREAAVAAALEHPGICTVHDTGTTDGTPWFAMQYVEGETLAAKIRAAAECPGSTEFISFIDVTVDDDETQDTDESTGSSSAPAGREDIVRITEMIENAARALHAAHEAGVIHRDIKPSNIMIRRDGTPVIMDFGLARMESPEGDALTATSGVLGTPAYMSPEQLSAPTDVDRRTDVWGLGVTLFECLTLVRPFDAPTREALFRAILEADAPDIRGLNAGIPGDLRVILETVLEKSPDRRYLTALDLAEDLRRFREREPIHARPAGAWLKLRRWCERRPAIAAGLVVTFLALSVALAVSLSLLDTAKTNEQLANRNADRADEERRAADQFANILETTLIEANYPETARGTDVTLSALVDDIAEAVKGDDILPKVRGRLHQTIGRGYVELARFDEADDHLGRALTTRTTLHGDDSLEVADTLEAQALLHSRRPSSDLKKARELARRVVDIRTSKLDDDSGILERSELDLMMYEALERGEQSAGLSPELVKVLAAIRGKGETVAELTQLLFQWTATATGHWSAGRKDEVAEFIREKTVEFWRNPAFKHRVPYALGGYALRLDETRFKSSAEAMSWAAWELGRRYLGETHPHVIFAQAAHGRILQGHGKKREALPWFEGAHRLSAQVHGSTDTTGELILELADLQKDLNLPVTAEKTLREAFALYTKTHPPHARWPQAFRMQIGQLMWDLGRAADALPVVREAVEIERGGLKRPRVLADCLKAIGDYQGRLDEHSDALEPLREALDLYVELEGETGSTTLQCRNNLGWSLLRAGKLEEAERELTQVAKAYAGMTEPAPGSPVTDLNLGEVYYHQRRFEEAAETCRRGLLHERTHFGSRPWQISILLRRLGFTQMELSNHDGAIASFEELWKIRQDDKGRLHRETLRTGNNLAWAYREAGKMTEAETLYREVLARWKEKPAFDSWSTTPRSGYAVLLFRAKRYDDAASVLLEMLDALPDGSTERPRTVGRLGAALREAKRFAEAEKVLLGARVLAKKPYDRKDRLTQGFITELVKLYEAWGRDADAKRWREELSRP